jgi:hypothetical protein
MATGALRTTPNFLVIGAAKSGTTTVWHYLRQHPQIYMSPRKHVRFFSFEVENPEFRGPGIKNPSKPYAITDIRDYHALFDGVEDQIAIGEASHSYLYQPMAAERIRRYARDMRLIAILRNPAERAYSHYMQMKRDGREPLADFRRALEAEEERVRDNWWPDFHYVRIGLYHSQLQRYVERFDRNQLKVYLYEDLKSDPYGMMRDLFRFLDVDDAHTLETALNYNASGLPKNKAVHTLLKGLRTAKPVVERVLPERQTKRLLRLGSNLHNRNLTKSALSPETRRSVTNVYFREDILKLQDLIQRDLSAWLR